MMSNEEWERKMDFLLNQQARFDADEALRKLITRFDRHLSEDHPGLET